MVGDLDSDEMAKICSSAYNKVVTAFTTTRSFSLLIYHSRQGILCSSLHQSEGSVVGVVVEKKPGWYARQLRDAQTTYSSSSNLQDDIRSLPTHYEQHTEHGAQYDLATSMSCTSRMDFV